MARSSVVREELSDETGARPALWEVGWPVGHYWWRRLRTGDDDGRMCSRMLRRTSQTRIRAAQAHEQLSTWLDCNQSMIDRGLSDGRNHTFAGHKYEIREVGRDEEERSASLSMVQLWGREAHIPARDSGIVNSWTCFAASVPWPTMEIAI